MGRFQRCTGNGSAPCFAGQGVLFAPSRLKPDDPVLNLPVYFRLIGPLDTALLKRCLDEIVRRHVALRTHFEWVESEPVQSFAEAQSPALAFLDLRHWSDPEREGEAQRLMREQARQPFDLASSPLIRATLLRLGEQEHALLLTFHRGIFDDWSRGVLFRELAELYGALAEGRPSPLRELPIQNADFALWQPRWFETEPCGKQLAYWKQRLDDAPAALELPVDRARPLVPTHRGGRIRSRLSVALTAALLNVSRAEGTTLFVTLLTALKALLSRYSGRQDILVSSPVDGRISWGAEGMIGPFANTLVLRADLSGDPTFRQLLAKVHQTALESYEHQDVPFERVIEELRTEENQDNLPLVQVQFLLRDGPRAPIRTGQLVINMFNFDIVKSFCEITLEVTHADQGLDCLVEYSADLFDAATIERMLGHLRTLLGAAADDPDRRLSALPILTQAERHQMLVAWNDTATDYPRDACFHELFEIQAQRTPETIAVSFEGQELTYDQLNRQANQLAHHLRGQGVGPDTPVGICTKRSLEMMVGLLGVLKAGGAYVPLDPNYPQERLAWILADSRVPVLLTQQRLLGRLPDHAARVIALDRDWSAIAREPETNPVSGATADHLAYVIYTSGSTGKPKGTLIVHRGLVNYLTWCVQAYDVAGGRRSTRPSPSI